MSPLEAGELVDRLEDLVEFHGLFELLGLYLVELVKGKLELRQTGDEEDINEGTHKRRKATNDTEGQTSYHTRPVKKKQSGKHEQNRPKQHAAGKY